MIAFMVMLNNLFHDMATAFVVVATLTAYLMVRAAASIGGDAAGFAVRLYPKMLHATAVAFALLLMAGIVRSFTYGWYEWVEGAGSAQVPVLVLKHILLVGLTLYGAYLWVQGYRIVKRLKEAKDGRA